MLDPLICRDDTSDALVGLLAQVASALAIADELDLHAAGIALDTARIAIEDVLGAHARRPSEALPPP